VPAPLYLVTAGLTLLTAISSAASLIVIPELLPRSIRVTGLSIAYAVGVSLFGGRRSLSSPGFSRSG